MADKVYPSAKPAPPPATVNGGANPAFPANKAQLYNASRPAYRPQPPPRKRHRRGCCCSCCLWTTLIIIFIIFIAAIAGAVFYVLYRPHRPSFSVTSLQLSTFNLTDTSLTSSFNFTLTAHSRNSKITFDYDQISVKILSSDIDVGDGSFPAFTMGRKSVTVLRSVVSSTGRLPEGTNIKTLRSNRNNLPIKIQLDTKVRVKMGKINTKKIKLRVTCDGIKIAIPSGRTATVATTSKVKCKADPRIKILKWTV